MQYLGGFWGDAALVARLVPPPVRDLLYRIFAGNRRYFRWMGLEKFDERTWSRILPESPDANDTH